MRRVAVGSVIALEGLTAPVLGAGAAVLACRCVQAPGCCERGLAKEACS